MFTRERIADKGVAVLYGPACYEILEELEQVHENLEITIHSGILGPETFLDFYWGQKNTETDGTLKVFVYPYQEGAERQSQWFYWSNLVMGSDETKIWCTRNFKELPDFDVHIRNQMTIN